MAVIVDQYGKPIPPSPTTLEQRDEFAALIRAEQAALRRYMRARAAEEQP